MLLCPSCKRETAEREPGEPRSMERYICSACGHELFVRVHYVEALPQSVQRTSRYECRYLPSSGLASAKAYLQLKRLLTKYSEFRSRNFEEQYVRNAPVWVLGTFFESECEQFVREAAAIGLVIEVTRESAT